MAKLPVSNSHKMLCIPDKHDTDTKKGERVFYSIAVLCFDKFIASWIQKKSQGSDSNR